MTDEVKKFKGHVTIETIDADGNVVDRYVDHNLIMLSARDDMAEIMGGVITGEPINKFVLGTEGHNVDILVPKTALEGFVNTRTNLFSEQSGATTYPITFTNGPLPTDVAVVNSEIDTGTTISRVQLGSGSEWTITIPPAAANFGGVTVYTEAALYTGTKIFSMKTFAAKVKDNTVSLKVIWKITF